MKQKMRNRQSGFVKIDTTNAIIFGLGAFCLSWYILMILAFSKAGTG
jgi:hypothetical protein